MRALRIASTVLFVFLTTTSGWAEQSLTLKSVQSGRAAIVQSGRTTILRIQSKDGTLQKVPLTHDTGLISQGTDSPYEAKVIAEIPGQLLIFTDTFSSNPANPEGRCGASETGERYVHVISFIRTAQETFSLPIESCRRDLVAASGSPAFNLSKRTLTVRFESEGDSQQPRTQTYFIAPDNSVKSF